MIKCREIVGLILLMALFSSCEKVIDVNLNNAEKKFVIEAKVPDSRGAARVAISLTQNFDEPNGTDPVTGASVKVTERGGAVYTFTDSGNGYYGQADLVAEPGKTYDLEVVINGQTFTATSTVPTPVAIDSLFITDESFFGETRKMANVTYTDPAGRGNYYRFLQYINNVRQTQYQVMSDDYIDGRTNTSTIFNFSDEEEAIKSGDRVRVILQSIDAGMYKYWYSLLRGATGGDQQAAPSNPVTNLRGGALGYFSAHTEKEMEILVP